METRLRPAARMDYIPRDESSKATRSRAVFGARNNVPREGHGWVNDGIGTTRPDKVRLYSRR